MYLPLFSYSIYSSPSPFSCSSFDRVSTFLPMPGPSVLLQCLRGWQNFYRLLLLRCDTRQLVTAEWGWQSTQPERRASRTAAARRYRVSSPALSESGFSPRVSRLVSSLASRYSLFRSIAMAGLSRNMDNYMDRYVWSSLMP